METSGTDRGSTPGRSLIARIDSAGWGTFFVWVGVSLAAHIGWGIALLGTGAISLGVQVTRRLLGLPVDRWSAGFGICLVVAGLLLWLDIPSDKAPLPAWAFPVAFVALGIVIFVRAWTRRD